ncbi:MAG: hypothetical protein TU35_002395 [Thermoproteus sp. AZ2]|uniref:Uncharacterized protein n=1 Tax=Thermoproteus sp. AZ2 TaxID=1609232 RepID=A0ACC6V0E8_9CREN
MSCNEAFCSTYGYVDCWKCPVISSRIKVAEALFRKNLDLAARLKAAVAKYSEALAAEYGKDWVFKIMDFCGAHEWTIVHFGIRSLMPKNVELVAGPGAHAARRRRNSHGAGVLRGAPLVAPIGALPRPLGVWHDFIV